MGRLNETTALERKMRTAPRNAKRRRRALMIEEEGRCRLAAEVGPLDLFGAS